jgi:hypothetical protein
MTTPLLSPDATRCPQCSAPLTGAGACGACGLRLTGPEARRLWEVDSELLRLDAARMPLLAERSSLLAALRGEPVPNPAPRPGTAPAGTAAARPEWTPARTSNALLTLGGLLLAVAALVFAAVTYERLGAGGRALVLLALTTVAALAVPRARLRGLTSTAEALAAVALVLAALDAYGLRTLGLASAADPLVYAAGSAAVLAVVSAGYAALVPVRVARCAAVVLAQLPPLLLLLQHERPSAGTAALVVVGLAAADLALVAVLHGRGWARPDIPAVAAGCATVVTPTAGLAAAFAALLDDQPGLGALGLVGVGALLAAGAALVRDPGLRTVLSALPVGALALAAHAAARPELSEVQAPLVPAAVALLAVQASALLPRALRPGPVLGALAVAAAAALSVAEQATVGVLAPLTWLVDPWSRASGADARASLQPLGGWEGTLATTVVLAAAATAVVGAGVALHRRRAAVVPAASLAGAAVVLLPLGLDLTWPAALGLLLMAGAGALLTPRPAALDLPLAAAGTAVLLLACAWSVADRTATLVVLPLAAAALAAGSRRAHPAPGAALTGLLGAAELAAVGAAEGLAADQVGGLLLLAVAALAATALAATALGTARPGLEAAAAVTGLVAVLMAAGDAGWLSWTLAGLALIALATGLRPDRRAVALAGGLLLSASSWVRLADAGVDDPEPYVLPLALAALALGHLRRRSAPSTSSFAAYGPGLSALLLPSLLASYAGSPLWRPLSLGAVALAVVLLGARGRLQAPLVLGGAVLAADALLLLAPYAAALPRWLALAAAGALLLAVGATYEQRLRDLARLRDRYDALG